MNGDMRSRGLARDGASDAKLQRAIHAPIGGLAERLPYNADMGEIKFLVTRERDGRVSVEMTKPNGRPRVFPDFRDEAEAEAWIVQTQRLLGIEMPRR